jgi:two-component system, cell cycle sensor histidine kinase and response regulator CckA
MTAPVRILHLEDQPRDSDLVDELLRAGGVACELVRVDGAEAFTQALEAGGWDLVLSDFRLPGYDGGAALQVARERSPRVPFIFISGTLGEDNAVEMLKRGATDYVLKQRLERLVPAVRRAVAEARDRLERERAEQQLRDQAALLDQARDAILVQGLDQRVTFWNRGAERLFGWTAHEALGRDAASLFFGARVRGAHAAHEAVLQHDQWSGDVEKLTKRGTRVMVESRWTLLRDDAGQPRSVLVIDSDMTEQRRLEAQLLRTQRMESLGTLAGGIAHDLNNVLAPILMAVDVLRRGGSEDRRQRMLTTIEAAANRGAELVKQVVTFARGVDGERVVLQPRQLLREIERIVTETFPSTIHVRVEAPGEQGTVSGDATQLHQVLLNLCVNARDALPRGGILTLRAEQVSPEQAESLSGKTDALVLLSVSDTGVGIPSELLGRIFEPFFTTKESGQGSGLGLSTSLAIVKAHGGFMQVESEAGRGTTFRVYLPAAQVAAPERLTQPALPSPPAGTGQHVLVVDDEASVRELTRETLESHGYRVETAADGAEAVALFARASPSFDLVLTDLTMPYMDGRAAIRALRRIEPRVKVVLMSGSLAPAAGDSADDGPVVPVLLKPYTAGDLLRQVAKTLGTSS